MGYSLVLLREDPNIWHLFVYTNGQLPKYSYLQFDAKDVSTRNVLNQKQTVDLIVLNVSEFQNTAKSTLKNNYL